MCIALNMDHNVIFANGLPVLSTLLLPFVQNVPFIISNAPGRLTVCFISLIFSIFSFAETTLFQLSGVAASSSYCSLSKLSRVDSFTIFMTVNFSFYLFTVGFKLNVEFMNQFGQNRLYNFDLFIQKHAVPPIHLVVLLFTSV